MRQKNVAIKCFRSDQHNIFTYASDKIGLSAFDDKRWICEDGITTRAHGHFKNEDLDIL